MKPKSSHPHVRSALLLSASALAIIAPASPSAHSQVVPSVAILRVEEDWEMVLNDPNNNLESPQFHTIMSPYSHTDSFYAQVLWNYRETPDFTPGGLQLQSWESDFKIRQRTVRQEQLSTSAETITWTQSLSTDGTILSFEIFNGQSTTWGSFGKDMRIDSDANLPDLITYSPETSVANSLITYGSNRVNKLVLKVVRRYAADGSLFLTDSTPRVVYELNQ